MNILVGAENFGTVLTYENSAYEYYKLDFVSSPYTTQYKTIIDGKIISDGEWVMNAT